MAHPLIPLLILFIVLLIAAVIGYVAYTIANDIADKTSKNMEKHQITVTKDGMKVGIKHVKEEDYVQGTQKYSFSDVFKIEEMTDFLSVLVKAWNYSSWPAYKSRFWNKDAEINKPNGHAKLQKKSQ
jgi:hypothetical protein